MRPSDVDFFAAQLKKSDEPVSELFDDEDDMGANIALDIAGIGGVDGEDKVTKESLEQFFNSTETQEQMRQMTTYFDANRPRVTPLSFNMAVGRQGNVIMSSLIQHGQALKSQVEGTQALAEKAAHGAIVIVPYAWDKVARAMDMAQAKSIEVTHVEQLSKLVEHGVTEKLVKAIRVEITMHVIKVRGVAGGTANEFPPL